jgi:hypothetical protein
MDLEKNNNNFDFCICIPLDLCYGVYIPVMEGLQSALLLLEVVCVTGLPARTARTFVPSFFAGRCPHAAAWAAFFWCEGGSAAVIGVEF